MVGKCMGMKTRNLHRQICQTLPFMLDFLTTFVVADSQGKDSDNLLEEHHILTLFHSGQ